MDRVGAASSKVDAGSQEQSFAADLARANWRKSSYSAYNGACVEVAHLSGMVAIQDTRDRGNNSVLIFSESDWTSFLLDIKRGKHRC